MARLGGDEFVVMLEELSEIPEEAAAQAKAVGRKNTGCDWPALPARGPRMPQHGQHRNRRLRGSSRRLDEILQQAEIALYQAKAAGRNTMRFFSPALQAAVNARAAMEEDLRQAIKANQFLLYYQPQVDRGRLIGAEALIRWKHPRRGIFCPASSFPWPRKRG